MGPYWGGMINLMFSKITVLRHKKENCQEKLLSRFMHRQKLKVGKTQQLRHKSIQKINLLLAG